MSFVVISYCILLPGRINIEQQVERTGIQAVLHGKRTCRPFTSLPGS